MRVLIVDDEPGIRKTTRLAVEAAGHTAAEAPNGLRVLKLLDEEIFDAAFLDLKLGRRTGWRCWASCCRRSPPWPS